MCFTATFEETVLDHSCISFPPMFHFDLAGGLAGDLCFLKDEGSCLWCLEWRFDCVTLIGLKVGPTYFITSSSFEFSSYFPLVTFYTFWAHLYTWSHLPTEVVFILWIINMVCSYRLKFKIWLCLGLGRFAWTILYVGPNGAVRCQFFGWSQQQSDFLVIFPPKFQTVSRI